MSPGWHFVGPARAGAAGREADWQRARPRAIERALARALAQPAGSWYVLDGSRRIGAVPRAFEVSGQHLIAWRNGTDLCVAPEACPHMGASLVGAKSERGDVRCPWHGLLLGRAGHASWQHCVAHDDGVLAWVRLERSGEEPTELPVQAPRPSLFIDGVVRAIAACEPADVLANRLDPWHGAHLHPYAFGALEVLEETEERLTVRVEKRIAGPLGVEVDATFHCPDARTIVMTIVAGEGRGSVVETHATPLRPGHTAIVEATLATSERPGFRQAQKLARWIRPFIERSARRLWIDDKAYAERLNELRRRRGGA